MIEDLALELEATEESMQAAIEHLKKELATVRAGKASPAMLSNVTVDYYGTQTPINQVASVSAADGRTLNIQPWEKSMLPLIEKAIFAANLGVTPQNDGEIVRITIPPMTEERRRQLVKQVRAYGESAKVSIRNVRRDTNDTIKKMVKDGLSEDQGKNGAASVQDYTNSYSDKADALVAAKEKEILTI